MRHWARGAEKRVSAVYHDDEIHMEYDSDAYNNECNKNHIGHDIHSDGDENALLWPYQIAT